MLILFPVQLFFVRKLKVFDKMFSLRKGGAYVTFLGESSALVKLSKEEHREDGM